MRFDVLLGTVTDGDIRAGILKGMSLDSSVDAIMHRQPTVARPGDQREGILNTMRVRKIHHVPVVDNQGRLIGLETLDALIKPAPQENLVVLMAGGLGTRLRPLTDARPDPCFPSATGRSWKRSFSISSNMVSAGSTYR